MEEFEETERASSIEFANSEEQEVGNDGGDYKLPMAAVGNEIFDDDKLVRTHYTFAFKLLVIEQAKENGNVYAAEIFNLDRRVIAQWRRQEDHIRLSLAQTNASRARLVGGGRKPQSAELEERLFDWLMKFSEAKRQTLSGRVIKQEARRIAEELGLNDFVASSGWLRGFQERAKRKMVNTNEKGSAEHGKSQPTSSNRPEAVDELMDDSNREPMESTVVETAYEHVLARGRNGKIDWRVDRAPDSPVRPQANALIPDWNSILRILPPDAIAELRTTMGRRRSKMGIKKEVINRCYDVTFKLKVVERAIECGDTVQAAREFNVDRHCVAAWRKKEAALRIAVEQLAVQEAAAVQLTDSGNDTTIVKNEFKTPLSYRFGAFRMRKRLSGGGRKQVHPDMDSSVVEELKREADRQYGASPSTPGEERVIKPRVAMELAIGIARDLGVADRFTASAGWLSRFCQRNWQRLCEAGVVVRRKKDE